MPLPTGTWKAIVNGAETALSTATPNAQGQFGGTLFGTAVSGFWDESSQKMTFTYVTVGGAPETAVFEGHLFRTPPDPGPGQDVVASLAGTFQMTVAGSGNKLPVATARRNTFAWLAQITEVL